MTTKKSSGSWIWAVVLLLVVVHQDNWLWNNDYAVFGFIPIGLFFHACISVAAAVTWFVAIQVAWPKTFVEEQAPTPTETTGASE